MFVLVPSSNGRDIYQKSFGKGFQQPVNLGNLNGAAAMSGIEGLGFDWGGLVDSITDTTSSILKARYGQPNIQPGTTIQRRANPQTGVMEEILVRSDGSVVGGAAQIPAAIATTGFMNPGINSNLVLLGVGAVVVLMVLKKR